VKRTWLIVVVVAVLGVAGYLWMRRDGAGAGSLDLVEAFRAAEKRTPMDPSAAFSIEPQTIQGVTKPAIFAHPPSRITYHDVKVPPHARLTLFLGLLEDAWPRGTDGVYFRVGIVHGDVYKDLVTRNLDPYRVAGDRGWVPIEIDLSEYAGQTIKVVLNTHESLPGVVPNAMYDFAVFGAPQIVVVPQS
jgi:hypothetical protein